MTDVVTERAAHRTEFAVRPDALPGELSHAAGIGPIDVAGQRALHPGCGAIRPLRVCEYADLCGGSRGRAYASSGDRLGEDSACGYQPARS